MFKAIALLALLVSTPALAQNVPQLDPEFLQQALTALQAQRNHALDEAAGAEAQLAQAQKLIADLQKQLAAKKDEPKP